MPGQPDRSDQILVRFLEAAAKATSLTAVNVVAGIALNELREVDLEEAV